MTDVIEQIEISFCLPVYNVQQYLGWCLNSIVQVKNVTFEIICVDDSSTDGSYQILKEYEKKYNFFRVFRNDINRGVSYTRNKAIEVATGKYIWFVDPDDMIVPDCARLIVDLANKNAVNCLMFDYSYINEDAEIIQSMSGKINYYIKDNFGLDVFSDYSSHNAEIHESGLCGIWACIFNREFLNRNSIRFYEKLVWGEDIIFHYDVLLSLEKFVKVNAALYNYRIRENSAVSEKISLTKAKKLFANSYEMWRISERYIKDKKYNNRNNYTTLEWLTQYNLHCRQDMMNTLAMVSDEEYVRMKYAELVRKKIYPYPFRTDCMKTKENWLKKVMLYLLPIPPVFWFVHYLYRWKYS